MTTKEIKSWGSGGLFGNRELGSLFLLLVSPLFCIAFVVVCCEYHGDVFSFVNAVTSVGIKEYFLTKWPTVFDATVWQYIFGYMALELFLMRFIPGKEFKSTITSTGHIPVYNANGIQCYIITVGLLCSTTYLGYFDPTFVYDNFSKFIASMNLFATIFCAVLVFKGKYFPSTKDNGSNGSLIVDYFWGRELYPRILGWDVKQFTNCRFGMMFWQVGIICYAFKQIQLNGSLSTSMIVSVLLQSIYIAKFFWWETGYFCSMDIQHDRAGYYICWGCLVWVPSMYTIHTLYLVEHPIELSIPVTALFLVGGIFSIWCNYDCDRQRQDFRASNGKQKIWGKEPQYIVANYTTKDGEKKSSLLLVSGWWGLARHFHYVPEIAAAFFWSAPAVSHFLPYFYPVYLTLLLADRAWRDDKRCGDKYKEDWNRYCQKVPFKIVPGMI
eukprot:gene7497-10214_t